MEGEGGSTRKREGQRVGEGPVDHSVEGIVLWGWALGLGLDQNPLPGREVMARGYSQRVERVQAGRTGN